MRASTFLRQRRHIKSVRRNLSYTLCQRVGILKVVKMARFR